MRRTTLLLAILMIVPGVAAAQRGGRTRSGATSRTNMFPDEQALHRANAVSSSKLRDLDPLSILIDKHKDMQLSDSQVNALKSMNEQLQTTQKPTFHALDSLDQQLANFGSNSSMSSGDQARMRTTTMFVRMVAGNIRQQYDSVEKQARGLLNDQQKKKANDVLKDSHNQLAKLVGRSRGR